MTASPSPASSTRRWLLRGLVVFLALGFVAATAGWLKSMSGDKPSAKRQVARLALLPDTPPPPPPPPERPPEAPKPEQKPQPEELQKLAEAPKPANEPIKMEGAAGDGPSAFAAGSVKSEYSGGAPNVGTPLVGAGLDRSQERYYANAARQLLRDALERNFKSDADEATAVFSLWVEADGSIRRFAVASTGDTRLDGELNAALDETARSLRLPPPPGSVGSGGPMRFRLTVKSLG
jgi:outer membrane biosynthesis protein TonB